MTGPHPITLIFGNNIGAFVCENIHFNQKGESKVISMLFGCFSVEYANAIERCKAMYLQEAGMLVKQGNRDKAQILVTKKKIIEKEVRWLAAARYELTRCTFILH